MSLGIIEWKSILEGLLFAAGDEGLSIKQLTSVLEIDEATVLSIIEDLKEEYQKKERGIDLVEVAGVYQLTTKKEHAPYLKRLMETPMNQSLSQAALETLAIIAYKQPITRIEIEEIRGVKSERPIRTLLAKGLIQEVGREEGVGRAILYGTTKEFLEYFGLKTIEELPSLTEIENEEHFIQEEADLFFEKLNNL
ncbi:MAG: SMC-Scp complex subunit ScpB [Bacillaceae bacterium]|jgi:segregation and condensation protein B|uniref:Segregation and condensation protein B n=1 Tax=Aeribacillus pallidus TaxID=33936 RepID=A0A165XDD1_9BACI|nr:MULTISPECIES: SMC-Scp complex subunit ScpB [Aeribacillus]AXI40067.1 SMC-Scp complex subunit ScpB [Bacillaceae bacterium ZC4]REJ17529.1 MAG: SMC-Scp complex subunit ScpB [Bacillaceae bacterium]ASS91788.1 SMC-Scp complex subunit ScpB [Aeribacillus pallidus]KZM56912.1 SMC-Scp complex subunit ScpB [Aeribacillus pallidus]KZN95899.1 SMC-Scp complex subunit ScpB [Aeribacillus pallidus]